MKVRKAIIPAAGMGTRFLPATKAIPKEMMPIIDKPTIQYIVEEAVASGIEEIMIVTSKGKRSIEDHFDSAYELEHLLHKKQKMTLLRKTQEPSQMLDLHFVRQKEPLGLGHAIWCAHAFVKDEPFAVLLGDTFITSDTPCLKQMIDAHNRYQTSIIGVQHIHPDATESYGMIEAHAIAEKIYSICKLIEKPKPEDAPSDLAMIGRYILTPRIFEILEHQKPGVGQEIQLTDALVQLHQVEALYACEIEGIWHDVGDQLGYIKTILAVSLLREDLKEKVLDVIHQLLATR